jgi:hypothetical protein
MRDMAEAVRLCECMAAAFISGYTDTESNFIRLNSHRIETASAHLTIAHELGHVFFGKGHPTMPGHAGFGGIMDYNVRKVQYADWLRFHGKYNAP